MSPDTDEDAASWSVVDAATHGSSTHPGSAQRGLWPLEPLVPSPGVVPDAETTDGPAARSSRRARPDDRD